MLSLMLALPYKGYLDQLFYIFAYLKQRYNAEIVFDYTEPDFDENSFPKEDWTYTPYTQEKEEIPSNVPDTWGFGFTISANVDSNHTGNSITCHSQIGFIIFLNNSPIYWFSKK